MDVFALPARLAAERRKKVVVALDEFRAVAGFSSGSSNTPCVRRSSISAMSVTCSRVLNRASWRKCSRQAAVLDKAGPVIRLDKIPPDEFADFIDEDGNPASVLKPVSARPSSNWRATCPYDVQRLAHETWDEVRTSGRRRATLDDLHSALRRLLSEQQTLFEARWQRLTLSQRAALRAVVIEAEAICYRRTCGRGTAWAGRQSVQSALTALQRDDLIARDQDRYVVVDSLLRGGSHARRLRASSQWVDGLVPERSASRRFSSPACFEASP